MIRRRYRILKLISALLFSIVALCGLHVGLWWMAMNQTESRLRDVVARQSALKVDIPKVLWTGYPNLLQLDLKDVTVTWSGDAGAQIRYAMGDISVRSAMFGGYRIEVDLPQEQEITFLQQGRELRRFEALIGHGNFAYFERDHDNDATFTAASLSILDKTTSEKRRILKTSDVYLVRENASKMFLDGGAWTWRLRAKNLAFEPGGVILPEGLVTKSAAVDLSASDFPKVSGAEVITKFLGGQQAGAHDFFQVVFKSFVQAETVFSLGDFTLQTDDQMIAVRGELVLDKRMRPEGELTMTTDNIQALITYLEKHRLLDPDSLAEHKKLLRMLNEKASVSVALVLQGGQVLMNGFQIGYVPPIMRLAGFANEQ